jgi:hypothetical protein
MKRVVVLLCAMGALIAWTPAAEAAPVTINIGSFSGGTAVLHAPGTLADGLNVLLGSVRITGDLGTFDGYCVDLQHYDLPGANQATVDTMDHWSNTAVPAHASSGGGAASWLYNAYAADASGNQTKQAALSLAIWNSLYDSDFTVLGGSGFWATSVSTAYTSLADAYLGNLHDVMSAGGALPTATWLRTTDVTRNYSQDFIAPVPEPGTLLLVASGLACAARFRRRASRRHRVA